MDTARGLLMLRPSPAMAMAAAMVATVATDTAVGDMVVMAVATMAMARGLLRLSPAMATTAAVVMEATDMDVATTARGLLMLSPRPMLRLSPAMATTARGLLML